MKKLLSCLFAALFVLSSCNKDDVIEVDSQTAPRITLDSENAVYTIKSGRELTISPTYENADKALYVWKIDGKVVGHATRPYGVRTNRRRVVRAPPSVESATARPPRSCVWMW